MIEFEPTKPTYPSLNTQLHISLHIENIEKMRTLRIEFNLKHPRLNSPSSNHPFFIQTKPTSRLKYPGKVPHSKKTLIAKPRNVQITPKSQKFSRYGFSLSEEKSSRMLIVGGVSIGVVMILMGIGDEKALALGPEGPLMEEFWDNMRRYGLYALTVSTGVLYAVFQPIYELLKNPISAILVLTIMGGGIFIVSQVLSAMVGVSDFSYDYSN